MSGNEGETSMPYHASNLVVVEGYPHVLGHAFRIFHKYVKVFDLYFVATRSCPNYKVLHGATVFYQYIDNNDDGVPDNELAYANLKEHKATMVMFKDQDELDEKMDRFQDQVPDDMLIQDLEADETRPGSIQPDAFDEALEECFHLVTQGFVLAYPSIFGLEHGSKISLCMDSARGGYFKKVPRKYPDGAWYTYYDKTCDYECQITEYMYWAMSTILGAQRYRKSEIEEEWRPSTLAEIKRIDNPVYKLLTDPIYQLPTKLPVPNAGIPLYNDVQNESSSAKCKSKTAGCCGCCGNTRRTVTKIFKKFKL